MDPVAVIGTLKFLINCIILITSRREANLISKQVT